MPIRIAMRASRRSCGELAVWLEEYTVHEVKSIQNLLDQISHGEILLPEFQRGYVWNRDQVRGLMQSLYRKHPTGHLLTWSTYKPSLVRGGGSGAQRSLLTAT